MAASENRDSFGRLAYILVKFSLPLMLSGILQQLYNWADAFIVGNVVGELALAAVDSRLREEGIRNHVGLVASGTIRNSADIVKAIALGADAVAIGTAALIAMGCHMCHSCHTGNCSWGICTQRPDLTRRLNPEEARDRLVNLITGWTHEIKEIMGGMGINSIETLRGNRMMLRGVGLTDAELRILGVQHAGE